MIQLWLNKGCVKVKQSERKCRKNVQERCDIWFKK